MNKIKDNLSVIVIMIIFLILILGFEIAPLLSLVIGSFRDNQNTVYTLSQYKEALNNSFYLQSIRNSLIISLESSLLAIIIAMMAVKSISKLSYSFREKILMFSNMTANFAGIPLAFAFVIILGDNGVFTLLVRDFGIDLTKSFSIYSLQGLLIIYIYFQIPLGILLMYPAFETIKQEWKEAASILGASSAGFWKNIGIPILTPSIIGTFNTMFCNSMGAYATAVALTKGSINLLPIRIGALVSGDVFANPNQASALAVILAVIMIIINAINLKFVKRV